MSDAIPAQKNPDSAAALLDAVLQRQASIFATECAALLENDDSVHPHRSRVALRRIRTALAGFAPILDGKVARRIARRARSLFRTLGPLRDADVAAESFAEGDAHDVLMARATEIRAETRQKLVAAHAAFFADAIRQSLETGRLFDPDPRSQRLASADAALLGGQALHLAWTQARAYRGAMEDWDDETRHDFRKDLKSLRYIAEFFADSWPGKDRDAFLARLTKLQDELGAMNDIAVHFTDREPDEKNRQRFHKAMKAAENHWLKLRRLGPWWMDRNHDG